MNQFEIFSGCCSGPTHERIIPKFQESQKGASASIGSSPVGIYRLDKSKDGNQKYYETSVDKLLDEFSRYEVQMIEVWVEGKVESGGVTKLFVSAEGGAGIKLVLKPKK